MTNRGDDCYFFYYSTCTKGDSCLFRHCEAAMGSEVVCNLWQEGRCFRTVCKFRHMEITKNRKEIACYWETQPAGCQKPHCAFFHEKPRFTDGIFVPPNKSLSKNDEQPHEEPAPPPAAPLPTTANPQLRGVIKTETQEPVPSPTHPPVVINPADDDEDEDDQFSEGEDGKVGALHKSDDSLNFGVSTLEEIQLRKALKASMKRAGYPIQSADTSANGEKENIQGFFQPALYDDRYGPLVFEETATPRVSVAERLGRKKPNSDVGSEEGFPLRRGLAGRLGRIVDEEEPPQKVFKPIKDRLGLPGSLSPTQSAESKSEPEKAPEQIRIKTLEEIRQEKAAKSQSQNQKDATKTSRGVKRAVTVKDDPISHVKTFSEILRAKRKRQEEEEEEEEEEEQKQKARHTVEKTTGKNQAESDRASPDPRQVKVKTLEEIRREKAARTKAQQVPEAENKKSSDSEESDVKKPRLMRIRKLTPQTDKATAEKSAEVTEKPQKTPAAAPEITAARSNNVKVKTFEEIMREKRLRRQEMEQQAKGSAEAEPPQKRPEERPTLKRTVVPAKVSFTSPGSSSPSSAAVAPDSGPVRKPIPLKPRAAPGATSVLAKRSSSPLEAETESQSSSRRVPEKNTRSSAAVSPAKQTRATPQGPAAEDKAPDSHKRSPEHTADTKVRPKLNVKPSVVKPAVQVKPGQKRRGAERSAVAAVKPLNSSEPQQETTCRDTQEFPSSSAEAQLSSAVPHSPKTLPDSGSGSGSTTLGEELQTVPVFKQSQETKPAVSVAAAREACTVPQSPALKSPTTTQPKSRRLSAAAAAASSSSSAVDDFEELINEFTDDHLEEDVDPGIGEEDLLLELSEMIDS